MAFITKDSAITVIWCVSFRIKSSYNKWPKHKDVNTEEAGEYFWAETYAFFGASALAPAWRLCNRNRATAYAQVSQCAEWVIKSKTHTCLEKPIITFDYFFVLICPDHVSWVSTSNSEDEDHCDNCENASSKNIADCVPAPVIARTLREDVVEAALDAFSTFAAATRAFAWDFLATPFQHITADCASVSTSRATSSAFLAALDARLFAAITAESARFCAARTALLAASTTICTSFVASLRAAFMLLHANVVVTTSFPWLTRRSVQVCKCFLVKSRLLLLGIRWSIQLVEILIVLDRLPNHHLLLVLTKCASFNIVLRLRSLQRYLCLSYWHWSPLYESFFLFLKHIRRFMRLIWSKLAIVVWIIPANELRVLITHFVLRCLHYRLDHILRLNVFP